jgi:uncharacterized repeat protein (TIGR02543 family)
LECLVKKSIPIALIILMSVSSCGLGGGIGRSLTVVYNGNGLSEGEVPEERGRFKTGDVVEVQGIGNMFKRGFNFQGWNTKADGSGFRYSPGFPIKMGEYNLTLYAQWGNQQYAVNYEGNGATSGEVPEGGLFSYGENFTVSGNIGGLTRAGRVLPRVEHFSGRERYFLCTRSYF